MNTKGHEENEKTNTDLFHHRGTPRNTENVFLPPQADKSRKDYEHFSFEFFRHGLTRD
jgi:hypothetical protein